MNTFLAKRSDATNILVSVIICTYNRAELVVRAINSVLAQQSVKLEIIVVDDCSSDDTYEILSNAFANQITLIRLNENRKVAYATNRGFELSTGEFIALLGDDDYWIEPNKLKKQLEVFKKFPPTLGVVGTWWKEKKSSGEMYAREPNEPKNWKERLLAGGGIICGSTPLIKREAWIAVDGLDERMPRGTDSDLFRRIILKDYTGNIIQKHTTVVDVGHGGTRMTTSTSIEGDWQIITASFYRLWKYRKNFIRHPKALGSRVKSLAMKIVKLAHLLLLKVKT